MDTEKILDANTTLIHISFSPSIVLSLLHGLYCSLISIISFPYCSMNTMCDWCYSYLFSFS